jgi:hypothetical protein
VENILCLKVNVPISTEKIKELHNQFKKSLEDSTKDYMVITTDASLNIELLKTE